MDLDVREAVPAPLITALGKELCLVQSINETVAWDEKHCQVDPGTHALAMVIDILHGLAPFFVIYESRLILFSLR